jgi:hypothetical protein
LAADLLSLISFFDRQGIPKSLLRNSRETSKAKTGLNRDEKLVRQYLKYLFRDTRSKPSIQQHVVKRNSVKGKFEDDVIALCDLYFISVAEDGAAFGMHGLVQLTTRKWLAANAKLEP